MGLIQTKGTNMWYLIQHNPKDITALSCNEDYERLKFQMINKQRFNSHCFYEIVHSSDAKLNR